MSPRGSGRGERRAVTGRHDGWWHYYDNFALHSGVEKVDASFTRLHASFINAPFRDSIFDWGNVSQFTGAPRAFRPAAMSEADGVPDVTDPSDMSEEAAAVKIQAMQRGKQARREHEELKRVQTAFVAFDTDGSGSLEIAELYDVLREVGVDIDKDTFADYQLALMEDYDADNSGTLDFREFRKFYEQVLANESTRKAYARELDAAVKGLVSSALTNVIERQEMEGAALKIQAVHRGKQARKELQEQREMESAAVKIQAVHRGKKARALYEQEKAELNSAALKIQAVHRGKQARSQIAKAKWSEEESRKARLAFWKFDEDQSGQLEVPELRGVLSSLGLTIPEQDFATYAAEIMAEFDTDGNGTLDYKEFEQFWLKCLASEELKAQYAAKVERACGKVVAGALANLYAKETEELAEQEELSAAAVKIQAVQRGKQARKEQEELFKVHAAFKKFDADKSGSLEIPELYDVLTEIGVELPREHFDEYVDALMDDYDTDNSGTLDFREFRKFYDQVLANENTKAEYAKELESAVSGLVSGAIANLYKREEEEEMSAAALKIQAVHRGKQARKQLQEQKEMESAALKIQAVHRGKQTRQSVDKTRRVKAAFDMFDADGSGELEIDELREVMTHLGLELSKGEFDHYAAALMEDYDTDNSGSLDFWEFEKFYEQCLASDDLRAAYANELDAAVKGVVSGALSNILEQHEMENAALKIQAVHRGKQARKELQEQREMEAAAVKIQAVHRGKMTRKNLVKPPPRASEAPPTPEPVAMSEEEELSAAAVKIQAVQRGKKARKEQEELFKVHAAFKKFDTDKSGSLEIPELYDVLQEIGVNLDQDTFDEYVEALMEDYDEDNSGTLDFREFRKFYDQVLANESTKAAYANELESAVSGLVSGAITNLFDRAEREEQENAALKIQAMHRGKKAREQLRKDRDEEEAAALKIQAMHRGRKTRQTLSRQKEAEAEEEELTAAALKIQAVHRGSQNQDGAAQTEAGGGRGTHRGGSEDPGRAQGKEDADGPRQGTPGEGGVGSRGSEDSGCAQGSQDSHGTSQRKTGTGGARGCCAQDPGGAQRSQDQDGHPQGEAREGGARGCGSEDPGCPPRQKDQDGPPQGEAGEGGTRGDGGCRAQDPGCPQGQEDPDGPPQGKTGEGGTRGDGGCRAQDPGCPQGQEDPDGPPQGKTREGGARGCGGQDPGCAQGPYHAKERRRAAAPGGAPGEGGDRVRGGAAPRGAGARRRAPGCRARAQVATLEGHPVRSEQVHGERPREEASHARGGQVGGSRRRLHAGAETHRSSRGSRQGQEEVWESTSHDDVTNTVDGIIIPSIRESIKRGLATHLVVPLSRS